MPTNQEKIDYIQDTVLDKGYNLNVFKIEYVNGHQDVIWNIPIVPHRVCEYFRQHDVKIIPIKGSYGLTSLYFDADPFPNKFYELVDGLPEYNPNLMKIMEYDVDGAFEFLSKAYPTMVDAVKEHYSNYNKSEIIRFLIKHLNFKDFVMELPNDKYIIEDLVMEES